MVFEVLRENTLYINFQKCTFLVNKLLFLGFNISSVGIQVDETKQKPFPTGQFQKMSKSFKASIALLHFSTIAAPLTDSMKKGGFIWGPEQQSRF